MWKCPQCGVENWDNANVCTRCRKFRSELFREKKEQEENVKQVQEEKQRQDNKSLTLDPPFTTKLKIAFGWSMAFTPFVILFSFILAIILIFCVDRYFYFSLKAIVDKLESEITGLSKGLSKVDKHPFTGFINPTKNTSAPVRKRPSAIEKKHQIVNKQPNPAEEARGIINEASVPVRGRPKAIEKKHRTVNTRPNPAEEARKIVKEALEPAEEARRFIRETQESFGKLDY